MDTQRPFKQIEPMQRGIQWIEARPLWALLALSSFFLLTGNWILPLIDRDEPRFAEASREMLQRSDFVVPHFNGGNRFDKPPFIYWCQAAAYQVLGQNEFAARLPSAVFATATAVVLLVWGRRLNQERAGLYAGLMFVSCLQVLIHGRLAVADMPMVFFVTLAVWCGWEMTRPAAKQGGAWGCWFFIALALGFLAKGPEAWLPLVGVVLGCARRPQEFQLKRLHVLAGMALSLALVAIWAVPALIRTHGEFFTVGIGFHVIHRSFGTVEGHGIQGWVGLVATLPLYFLTFFPSFIPWSFQVPSALRHWWGRRGADAAGRYLLMQAGVFFVVFTLVRTKLPHYTLPAFPCIALWLALNTTGMPAAGVRMAGGLAVMAGLILALSLGWFWIGPETLASNLWQQVRPAVTPQMNVASVEFEEPSLVWEFRSVATNDIKFIKAAEANAFLESPPPLCLVVPTSDLKSGMVSLPGDAQTFRATGYDTTKLRFWDVTAVIRR